jgi:nicotinamidase/pyrazinamidase
MAFDFDPQDGDALVVIDVQTDFLPGGALAVPYGDAILGFVEDAITAFPLVVLTQDWHPKGHSSFASSHPGASPFSTTEMPYGTQVLWPDHCVQGSEGADLVLPAGALAKAALVVRKGSNPAIDSYSAFKENDGVTETGLADDLRARGVRRVVLVGLATDYCVAYSALDARAMGFDVVVLLEGCRGISPDGVRAQIEAMQVAGVDVVAAAAPHGLRAVESVSILGPHNGVMDDDLLGIVSKD